MENKEIENRYNHLGFEVFLDALSDGAVRSRRILTLLFVGSFIAFVALVNSLNGEWNWFKSRIDSHREVSNWIVFKESAAEQAYGYIRLKKGEPFRPNVYEPEEFFQTIKTLFPAYKWNAEVRGIVKGFVQSRPMFFFRFPPNVISLADCTLVLDRLDPKRYERIMEHLAGMDYPTKRDFESIMQYLERANVEHRLMISIPIIGLAIDVNNLCWATAIAFSIFYFMLFFSLSRERKNLVLAFVVGYRKKYRLTTIFQLLSMRQILTIPGSIDENLGAGKSELGTPNFERKIYRIWQLAPSKSKFMRSFVPKAPLIFPALVWLLIFGYDWKTRHIGIAINSKLIWIDTGFSILTGLLMLFLCYRCFLNWMKIDDVWEFYAEKIKSEN